MHPDLPLDQILIGDCRELLKTLPDESVHCVVTSPPYWGLRSYGTTPQIWANGHEPCIEHQWADSGGGLLHENRNNITGSQENAQGATGVAHVFKYDRVATNTCSVCNAWRGELGLEPTPELYVAHLTQIFREVRRVLRDDGTLWLNLGDSYATQPAGNKGHIKNDLFPDGGKGEFYRDNLGKASQVKRNAFKENGLKPKDLVGIPWMVAFALRADGWYLRSDIIWSKLNPMPESVTDRPTKAHEYIFLLSKSQKYYYDADAVRENFADERMGNPGKNRPDKKIALGRDVSGFC